MKELLIATPAEVVGISKNEENTAIVRFGHLFKFPKKIYQVNNRISVFYRKRYLLYCLRSQAQEKDRLYHGKNRGN